jgi:hypothetical protein
MALWGVSSSDVTNCGWNTVVGCDVLLACASTAYIVKKLAGWISAQSNEQGQIIYSQTVNSQIAGAVMGCGVAVAACIFVPGSRFALISDDSVGKIFKLQIVQTVVGLIIDKFVGNKCHTATFVATSCAAATGPYGYFILASLGAVGAGLGSGFLER